MPEKQILGPQDPPLGHLSVKFNGHQLSVTNLTVKVILVKWRCDIIDF